jgi:hypothetical protein
LQRFNLLDGILKLSGDSKFVDAMTDILNNKEYHKIKPMLEGWTTEDTPQDESVTIAEQTERTTDKDEIVEEEKNKERIIEHDESMEELFKQAYDALGGEDAAIAIMMELRESKFTEQERELL